METFLRNPLWFYLIIVNLYVFGLMAYDKFQAKRGGWRIPEANLLFMGVIGGGLGGLIAMYAFRHKTLKVKFKVFFILGILFDIGLLYFSLKSH